MPTANGPAPIVRSLQGSTDPHRQVPHHHCTQRTPNPRPLTIGLDQYVQCVLSHPLPRDPGLPRGNHTPPPPFRPALRRHHHHHQLVQGPTRQQRHNKPRRRIQPGVPPPPPLCLFSSLHPQPANQHPPQTARLHTTTQQRPIRRHQRRPCSQLQRHE